MNTVSRIEQIKVYSGIYTETDRLTDPQQYGEIIHLGQGDMHI